MTSPSAARALGEDFLKRKMGPLNPDTSEARRVVTALLEALRSLTELARLAEGDTRPKVTTELTANAEARPALMVEPSKEERAEVDAITREAFPTRPLVSGLTVEKLARYLCEDVCGKHGLSTNPPCDDHIDQAERLLPRLAGPAQEGP